MKFDSPCAPKEATVYKLADGAAYRLAGKSVGKAFSPLLDHEFEF
jgi:hypothetical protein